MKQRRNSPLMMAATFIVVALVTLACGLSANSPNLSQLVATSTPVAGAVPNTAGGDSTATPGVLSGGNGGAADSTSTPAANTNSGTNTTPQVPQTGGGSANVPGNLAPAAPTSPQSMEQIYTSTNPGVVSILVQVNQNGQAGAGAGSGFILTDAGYIVTNHHVIDGASTIIVRFYNQADSQAKVVGDDPNADLAIIQVSKMATGAHPIPLGDSSKVRVGDAVAAIGNPFALGTSMSSGIISAVGRTIPSGFTPYNIPEALQTDAAINPGNSGGPLLNMNGEVIGINAQIQTGGSGNGSVGIGFAIPVNILKQIYPSLIKSGSYTWPYLGVSSPADNPLSMPTTNQQAQQGALIAQVQPGGPAASGGLKQGDVIVQADNQKINSFDDLLAYIAYKHPGDKVTLTVVRGGQQQQVTVTLGARPVGTQQSPQQ